MAAVIVHSDFAPQEKKISHSFHFFPFCFFPLFLCIVQLRRASYLTLLFILWNSAFSSVYVSLSPFTSLLFSAIYKASSDNHFAFLHLFFLGRFWSLPPAQCYESPSIILQAFCLPDIIPCIYLSPPLYNHKGFDLGHT